MCLRLNRHGHIDVTVRGFIIGLGQNNLWISHRGAVVKASSRHVRPAQSDELVPWHSIYEKASRGDQLPPPTPETEMPELSTGEQPTYLDMSVDTWHRPRHDQPEIDPETGLPTESGWTHRPYSGRGRRGCTWVRAEFHPQPEHGGDQAGRAAAAAAADGRDGRAAAAADEPMAPPTPTVPAAAPSGTPAQQMSGEVEAEAETEQRLLQGLDAEDPGVFNHPAFPFLGTDHTLPRPVFGPTPVPEPFQGPWTPIPEPVPEARPSTASSSSGHDQSRRAAQLVTEPALNPVPGQRRSAEHDPADDAMRQAAALRLRLLDDLPQQLRAGLRRARDLPPSERPQAEDLARLTVQPEAPSYSANDDK